LPVKGKPMTEYIVEQLKQAGVNEIIFTIGYKADQIQEYFGNGKKYGLKINYVIEKERLGTAGPLRLAEKYLTEPFFLIWADILTKIDLKAFSKFHLSNPGLVTIALATVKDPTRFGVAKMKGQQIIEFVEKPTKAQAPSNLINAGYAAFDPKAINLIPKKQLYMVENGLYPALAKKELLYGWPYKGVWYDTGTPESYEQVIKNW
jgi:NDP-sugar pyrophosphorylase family protein